MPFLVEDPRRLARFREGDRDVLAAVYQRHFDHVARTLRAGFHVRTPNGIVLVPAMDSQFDVECGCQEVFLRAFSDSARRAYDGVRPLRTYLKQIARNWRIDRFRSQGRWEPMSQVPEPDISVPNAESDLCRQELRALIKAFVGGLPERDRHYYEARYHDGQNQTNAAAVQGMTRIQGRRIESRIKRELLTFLRLHGHTRLEQLA